MKVNIAVDAAIIFIDFLLMLVCMAGTHLNSRFPGVVAVSPQVNFPNSSFCCKKHDLSPHLPVRIRDALLALINRS